MARNGFVSRERSRYGVHWNWVGRIVRVGQRLGTAEVWTGDELIAVQPQDQRAGQHFILPGHLPWAVLPRGDGRPRREAVTVQVPVGEVGLRSLDVYELAAVGGGQVIALELARQHLETLDLKQAVEILDNTLEVWPESHWPGFTLRQSDVFQSYVAT